MEATSVALTSIPPDPISDKVSPGRYAFTVPTFVAIDEYVG